MRKDSIQRILFWFKDGENVLLYLNYKFYPWTILLKRLMCEKYEGKKIKFINLNFKSAKTYELYPQSIKYEVHSSGALNEYNDLFDFHLFQKFSDRKQIEFIWEQAYNALYEIGKTLKNDNFLEAAEYAYKKGIANDLDPDFKMLESDLIIYNLPITAVLWANFLQDGMHSNLTLEKDGSVLFKKHLDTIPLGNPFFFEMFKIIEQNGNTIIIRGHQDIAYLPLNIPITIEMLGNGTKL